MRYSLDDGPFAGVTGEIGIAAWTISLGREPALIGALRRARRVRIQLGDDDFAIDLSGIGRALDAVRKCVAYYKAEG